MPELIFGAVSAAAPSLTGGTHAPPSIDEQGNLRVTPGDAGPGALAQGSDTSGQSGTLTMGAVTTAAPTYTTLKTSPLSLTTFGGQRVALIDSAGAELDYTSPTIVQGPTLVGRLISAAGSTNATLVKNAAGRVFNVTGWNANAAARWLKIYNKATAPTIGTDTPIATLYLAPTAAFNFSWHNGLYFATGIGYGLTTGSADNDTGAVTAADILALNLAYA